MKRLFLLPCLLISLLAAQTATEVEITAEPSHHLALENEYVRVFQVEVPPHACTLLHRHRHDYFFVTIGDSDISNEVEGKPPVKLTLADGDVRLTEGNFAHVARNLSDRPFRNVTIELLQNENPRQPRWRLPLDERDRTFPGGDVKILVFRETLLRERARVSKVELDPGATLPSHRHDGPHLLVAVTDLDLRSDIEGKDPVPFTLKAGDVKWVDGAYTHTVTNTSPRPCRFLTFEF